MESVKFLMRFTELNTERRSVEGIHFNIPGASVTLEDMIQEALSVRHCSRGRSISVKFICQLHEMLLMALIRLAPPQLSSSPHLEF